MTDLARRGMDLFHATEQEWHDWRWQMSHRLRTAAQLRQVLRLTADEESALARKEGRLAFALTPYYALLIDSVNFADPIRRTMVPVTDEFNESPEALVDPCAEDEHEVVPGVVHRYPDRVLVLPTNQCPVYCRYCTRNRWVGQPLPFMSDTALQGAVTYLKAHPEVRDVLISGGDPLILPDEKLSGLLAAFRGVETVEILRLGTKVVPTLPMRITNALVECLRRFHPLWINIHFIHPRELTPEVMTACAALADAGIPLNAQIVLLRGVNDSPAIIKELCQGLVRARVRPYYLYQCDPVKGALHFRTRVEKGIEIIESLRGHTTGFAVPTYVIDAPGGGGKVPVGPDYVLKREGSTLVLRNFKNAVFRYPDPPEYDV
jgi:lysine 2,3-aminomutase